MRPRERLRSAAIVLAPRLFLRFARPTHAELGACGEELAARHIAHLGFELLGRRVATPHAEIDLVARSRDRLVCVEVKTARVPPRPRPKGADPLPALVRLRYRPGARLSERRLSRQRRAGGWLAHRLGGGRLRGGRVDLCEVLVMPSGGIEFIYHANLHTALV